MWTALQSPIASPPRYARLGAGLKHGGNKLSRDSSTAVPVTYALSFSNLNPTPPATASPAIAVQA